MHKQVAAEERGYWRVRWRSVCS